MIIESVVKKEGRLSLDYVGISDIGLGRKNNEDVWKASPEIGFFALADGMGGRKGGEIAAALAIETLFKEALQIQKEDITEQIIELRLAIQHANQIILKESKENLSLQGMGTTLCCLFYKEHQIVYAHVGDSRIYCFRNQKLTLLTKDHSLYERYKKENPLLHHERAEFPYRHIITRALGISEKVKPEISFLNHEPNDCYLICTDGLSDVLSLEEMESILKLYPNLEICSQKLIEEAKIKRGSDNMTLLLIQQAIKN